MTVPDKTRAVVIDRFGGADELHVRDLPTPEPARDELLIRLDTAGVGSWDPLERAGGMAEMMEGKPLFPYILGSDGGGEVVAVGEDVDGFAVGDPVYAIGFLNPRGGFYREFAVSKAGQTARVPDGFDREQAGAMGSDAITAFQGVEKLGGHQGDAIAITGASGQVGSLALQFAKALGLRVLAIGSGEDGVEQARALGADAAVDGKAGDVAAAVKSFAPDGLAGALLFKGGDVGATVAGAVRPGGVVAAPNGVEPAPRNVSRYNGVPDRGSLDRMNALIERSPFRVEIGERFPLERVAEAHAAVEKHHVGKIVLKPGG